MMKNENEKTMIFAATAAVLALLATWLGQGQSTPDIFFDIGEPFFSEFTDPSVATALEIVEFDEDTAAAIPFKVSNQDGLWTIPSHHNYPADGESQLAETAASVIDIVKNDFRSDNVADHETLGVVDPLDETVSTLKGRGRRVTVKGEGESVLADFIIGNEVDNRAGVRFIRVPGQSRVYAVNMEIDISTKFEDWIEKDLLQVSRGDIDQLILNDYSINERTLTMTQRGSLFLEHEEDHWVARGMSLSEEIDTSKIGALLGAVDELSIVGVRPKPAGVSEDLTESSQETITRSDLMSLQSKGYYLTRDGRLFSNEGELIVHTTQGVVYTLRFGEIVYGRGDTVTAGDESNEYEESGPGENRYLFITVAFDESSLKEPLEPQNTDFENKEASEWTDDDRRNDELKRKYKEWETQVALARESVSNLSARFGKWYYVIPASSFEKVRMQRSDLVRQRTS